MIAAALGCLNAALIAWTSSDQPQPLTELLDRAMEAVGWPRRDRLTTSGTYDGVATADGETLFE